MMDQADRLRKIANGRKPSKVIAVLSGKGGVGKTNISLALSLAGRRSYSKVLLWDCDFGLADCDILLDLSPKHSIFDMFQGKANLSDAIVKGPSGIDVLPGGSGVKEPVELKSKGKEILQELLEQIQEKYELIVIDCAAGIGENVIRLALCADIVLLLTSPEVPAVADAYATLKVLFQSGRKQGVKLLVNMAADQMEAEKIGGRIAVVARRFLGVDVNLAGWIPYDYKVAQGVKMRKPFMLLNPYCPAACSVKDIWNRIEPEFAVSVGGFK